MKRIKLPPIKKTSLVLLCSIYFVSTTSAQNPQGWCSEPDPPVTQYEYTIYGIGAGNEGSAPEIDGIRDNIWNSVTEIPLNQRPIEDDDEMTGSIRWMYDDTYFYLLVEIMNDDTMGTGNTFDNFEFMYQKDFGGVDTGTVAGHDNDPDWRNWYWLRDGDRKWQFPSANSIINDFSIAEINSFNMETGAEDAINLQQEVLLNQSLLLDAVIDTNIDNTYNYTFEAAFTWDKWLNWDNTPTTDDTLAIDITFQDEDEIDNKYAGYIRLNDPDDQAWCTPLACAMVHIGEKSITGLQENADAIDIKVYPNPVTSILRIDTPEKIDKVSITDIMGQQIRTYHKPESPLINVDDLNNGIYILNIFINRNIITRKFIVQ